MVKKKIKKTPKIALYWYGKPTMGFVDFLGQSSIPEEFEDLDKTSAELMRKVGIEWQKITSEEITRDKLLKSNFKVLIIPSIHALSEEEVEHIRKFTENGGKIFGICTTFMTNILGGGVYFGRHFWLAPDRVALAKNIIDYLLKGECRKAKCLPGPKSKDKTRLGYWGCPGLPLALDFLKKHSLTPDILIGCIGMCRKGEIERVNYLSSSDLIKFGQKLGNEKIPFYFSSFGNPQIKDPYSDVKSQGKEVLPYSSHVIRRLKEVSGKYFLGCVIPFEQGTAQIFYQNFLTSARDMLDAKTKYIRGVKKVIDENRNLGIPSLVSFEHSSLHRYNYEAGIDFDHAETSYGKNINVQLSCIRGSAKAYKKPWVSDISIWGSPGNYVGCLHGSPEGLQLSFYFSYLYGSNPIIFQAEGVAMGAGTIMGKGIARKSIQANYEKVYQDFYRFTYAHPYPGMPEVKIAFLQGNLDAWHNVGQGWGIWGLGNIQKLQQAKDGRWGFVLKGTRPEWMYQDPEFGWDYLSVFYPGYTDGKGKDRYFSPTPYGQIDITPIEAPLDVLKQYDFLILTGWNTMTEEIYQKLKDYCKHGGHLFLSIPHLSTHVKREDAINGNYAFLKKGDYSDFLGIKVKGKGERATKINFSNPSSYRFPEDKIYNINGIDLADIELSSAKIIADSSQGPVLIENEIGKGKVLILGSWNYPGKKKLHIFMETLIKNIAMKHQGPVKIKGSEDIAYAEYRYRGKQIVYLLNTTNKTQEFILEIEQKQSYLQMKAASIRIVQ